MTRTHRIDAVLDNRLCSGCGACAYIAGDHGVSMIDIPTVGRRPIGVRQLPIVVKDQIAAVCPGSEVEAPSWGDHEPDANEVLVGPSRKIWEGWAADPELRWAGSSGGVVTALATYALERLGMALVVHTGMDPEKPWRNRTVISTDRTGLLENSGSRYTTSSPVEALRTIETSDRPCVFIGKPCDVAAVARLRRTRPALDRNLGLVLSFFCAGTPSSSASLRLASDLGFTKPEEITSMRYRGRGWPGNFTVIDEHGETASLTYDESWGQLASRQRQLRCQLCPDGLGELADVTGGDAWHRKSEGSDGISMILARTERGREIVEAAIEDGYLEATPSGYREVVAAQGLVRRRRVVGLRMAALRTFGLPTPRFPGFRLAAATAQLSMKAQIKEYVGMVRRIVQRNYFKPEPRSSEFAGDRASRSGVRVTDRANPGLVWLYGRGSIGRAAATRLINRLEGGEIYSASLREIFRRYHGVSIGAYTHGGCFVPHSFGRNTTIGRYTSIARTAFAATLDHPTEFKGMHGFFFNSNLGYTEHVREYSQLTIGNDVWLGHNAVISSNVTSIGDGAVIGAGAVVFKDVPPYAVVVGNPGRVVRYRFTPETIARLLQEKWWEQDIDQLAPGIAAFDRPFEDETEG
ncbi:MAG: Coenzyme F420 hydrogenase/dehydrogenase, beta subunit C-terminal domain [Propionicimonas sp.]